MTPERWQAEAEKFFGRPCYGTQYGDHDHICKICPLTRLLVEAVREFSPVPLCPHCGKNPPTYCATCWSQEHPQPSREALDAIIHNWEMDVAGLKNWISFSDLHQKAQERRKLMLESVMAWAQGQSPEPTLSPTDPRPVAGRCPAGHPIHWLPCRCCASCVCGYGWGSSHATRPAAGGRDA